MSHTMLGAWVLLSWLTRAAAPLSTDPVADGRPAVSVALPELAAPHRVFAIEFNPLPLVVGKVSVNLVLAPVEHHALVLSPLFATVSTAPVTANPNDPTSALLPTRSFESYGGELGYRYYFGRGGMRGVFVGPSVMAAAVRESQPGQGATSSTRLGGALDAGFQTLVADRLSLAIGAGVQYTVRRPSGPTTQFPATAVVDGGLMPRLLLSLGVAL